MRRPIRQLPSSVVAQVAAGEVVERPASIVKELIENSLDAGAQQITIEIEKGGRDSILVVDTGEGIPSEELPRAVQPHATSKLEQVEDLWRLRSYGFRGEALASIAAVSELRIESRTPKEEVGSALEIRNGEQKQSKIGMSQGTRVHIRRLFQSLPARQKFLKSDSTEWRHILQIVQAQAAAHPEVGWQLLHNQKRILDLPPGQNQANRLRTLLGESFPTQFLPIQRQVPHFGVQGYISLPQFATSHRLQMLFVNNRPVQSPLVNQTVREAYAQLVELDAQPSYFLWLEIPPETVDINIHPRKESVRFLDEQGVRNLIQASIEERLKLTQESAQELISQHMWLVKEGSTQSSLGADLKRAVLPSTAQKGQEIWQLHDLFLIFPTETGVRLIDQHAAHERILFEQFREAFQNMKQEAESVELSPALRIELTTLQQQLLQEYRKELEQLGFTWDDWKNQSIVLREAPRIFAERDLTRLLLELLADLAEGKPLSGIDTASQKMLAYLACRSAIKAGEPLTPEQRQELLEQLSDTPRNFTCPHGRPIMIDLSLDELYRLFKR